MDWYICYAAMKLDAQVLTADKDFLILNEAFVDLYNFRPAVYMSTFDIGLDRQTYKSRIDRFVEDKNPPPKKPEEPENSKKETPSI